MQSYSESRVEIFPERVRIVFPIVLCIYFMIAPIIMNSSFIVFLRDPYVIFSGGLPQDRPGRSASITVVHGRSITVLEMEHNVVDFVTLCDTPWASGELSCHILSKLLILADR